MKKIKQQKTHSDSGFTLIEVVISVALVGVVAMSFMRLSTSLSNGQKEVELRLDQDEFSTQFFNHFTDDVCALTLGTLGDGFDPTADFDVRNATDFTNARAISLIRAPKKININDCSTEDDVTSILKNPDQTAREACLDLYSDLSRFFEKANWLCTRVIPGEVSGSSGDLPETMEACYDNKMATFIQGIDAYSQVRYDFTALPIRRNQVEIIGFYMVSNQPLENPDNREVILRLRTSVRSVLDPDTPTIQNIDHRVQARVIHPKGATFNQPMFGSCNQDFDIQQALETTCLSMSGVYTNGNCKTPAVRPFVRMLTEVSNGWFARPGFDDNEAKLQKLANGMVYLQGRVGCQNSGGANCTAFPILKVSSRIPIHRYKFFFYPESATVPYQAGSQGKSSYFKVKVLKAGIATPEDHIVRIYQQRLSGQVTSPGDLTLEFVSPPNGSYPENSWIEFSGIQYQGVGQARTQEIENLMQTLESL